MSASSPLLAVRDLKVSYRVAGLDLPALGLKARHVQAVNGVSLAIDAGDTLGIVGESGCGKSTLARAILGLTEVESGEVVYDGALITLRERPSLARMRAQVAMIFQDPYASLNPRMPIGEALAEVLRVHRKVEPAAIGTRVAELLRTVGLPPQMAQRRPHQLSGGQCQRAGIARALAIEPRLVIADECVAALDVSIQAQILNLLLELQQTMKLALIFISHDLGVVRHLCRRIAIMYLGQVVEEGLTEEVFAAPRHPYTRALLAAVPDTDPDKRLVPQTLRGDPPSPLDLPSGCAFHPRCPHCEDICTRGARPALRAARKGEVACHFDF